MANLGRRSRLVHALLNPPAHMRQRLRDRKAEGKELRAREDLLWYLLVESAATHGDSGGWDRLRGDSTLLASVSYAALQRLPPSAREARILATFRSAKIRMQSIKAPRLAANFARIEGMGGVVSATKHMLSLSTREEKYRFMRTFAGIGEKYGRDVWMGIYDKSFRTTIAVDARLKNVARALGFRGKSYREAEEFFCAIARDAELEPWELDRLLYEFNDDFLQLVRRPAKVREQC